MHLKLSSAKWRPTSITVISHRLFQLLISESPCNPRISVQDLQQLGDLGRTREDLYTLVDATYATPYLVKPIKYGIDIVVHSA